MPKGSPDVARSKLRELKPPESRFFSSSRNLYTIDEKPSHSEHLRPGSPTGSLREVETERDAAAGSITNNMDLINHIFNDIKLDSSNVSSNFEVKLNKKSEEASNLQTLGERSAVVKYGELSPKEAKALQFFLEVRERPASVSYRGLTLKEVDTWRTDLLKAQELLKEVRPLTAGESQEFIRIAKLIESRRLTLSRMLYRMRYYKELWPPIENDNAIKRFDISEETRFMRAEVKYINKEYLKTDMYRKDFEGADNEYPDRKGSAARFIHACYRNYYDPEKGHIYATENWRDRDQAKMDGATLPNSELLINQALDVAKGDSSRLKINHLTQCIVSNKKSVELVQSLVELGETKTFVPGTEGWEDLQKIPNGLCIPYIAEQYRWLIGNKKVGDITVTRYIDQDYGYGDVSDITAAFVAR